MGGAKNSRRGYVPWKNTAVPRSEWVEFNDPPDTILVISEAENRVVSVTER